MGLDIQHLQRENPAHRRARTETNCSVRSRTAAKLSLLGTKASQDFATVIVYISVVRQMLLFPDPRPLVERLGRDFFRRAPEGPGVYVMRDEAGAVLYIGKAKNLRRRLAAYRVASPKRLRRRHLRLLRAVALIELLECPTEGAALEREAELLRRLRPPFNRAGTWPAPSRFLAWKATDAGLVQAITPAVAPGWRCHGPLGAGAVHLRTALLRLCWIALCPHLGLAQMPTGWFDGPHGQIVTLCGGQTIPADFEEAASRLEPLLAGDVEDFAAWVRRRTSVCSSVFDLAVRDADLEQLGEFVHKKPIPSAPVV